MKPQELRIGNKFDLYGQVATLVVNDFIKWEGKFDSFKPIPLTEEWLLKFGFVRNGMECNIPLPLGTGLELSIEDDGETCLVRRYFFDGVLTSDFEYAYVKHCKYVHQLQNLYFALTGEELNF